MQQARGGQVRVGAQCAVEFAGGFEALDFTKCFLVHGGHEYVDCVPVVCRNARDHVGNDQAFYVLLVFERVLQGKQAAPGMAIEVEVTLVELERLTDLLYFLDEAGQFPKFGGIRLVAVGRAQLVVIEILDASARKITVEGL